MVKRSGPKDPEKERRILDAAIANFARDGYQNAKTDQIAEQADVSKGLVFHYFGSKAKLYVTAVQASYDRLIEMADLSVWQDAPDLKSMILRATKYKIQMQIDHPAEFGLSMAAYADLGHLPPTVQEQVRHIWNSEMAAMVPSMIDPVIDRLNLRPGVKPATVQKLMTAMTMLIGEDAKALIQNNPDITISEMGTVIHEVEDYIDILEHGFLADA
jgi:AcrR family transcriptional regulator